MSRWLSLLILVLVLVVTGAWLAWYLAYGINDEPPGDTTLAGLSGPVQIGWYEEGYPVVGAGSEMDAYAALGYVHGIQRAWTMLLWRQAALGRQAEWFGDNLLDLDRFTRRLELGYLAQEAYDSLSTENKAILTAYASGVNASLKSRYVQLSDELAMLDLEPEPWEPWHSLALERLYAWLASPPPSLDTLTLVGADASAFYRSDAFLRDWLHLHGFEHSIAWAYADSQATHFFQRQVYGSSALPFFAEVVLQWPGNTLMGASIPGTPFFQAGKTDSRAWAILPRGTARLIHTVMDSTRLTPRYERLRSKDGTEQLLPLNRTGNTIYFAPPPKPRTPLPDSLRTDSLATDSLSKAAIVADTTVQPAPPPIAPGFTPAPVATTPPAPDSTWALTWSGFGLASDGAAWRSMRTGEAARFELLNATGLTLASSGEWTVIGAPATTVPLTRGVLVGNTEWARYVAQDLDSLLATSDGPLEFARITADYHSEWASELAPRLVATVDSIPGRVPLVNEALTYLRNWDYAYDRSSIAAAIFDTWISIYRNQTGHLPSAEVADTLFFENLIRYQTLGRAVSRLSNRFGDDLSQWRWENVYPDRRFFPVWSADSLISQEPGLFVDTRFAPVTMPGRGHPTTLYWGSSPVQEERLSPSSWAAWTSTDTWDTFFVRRLRLDLQSPLGRYRAPDRVPAPVALRATTEPERTTILSPLPNQP